MIAIAWISEFFPWELVVCYMRLAQVFIALPYTQDKWLYAGVVALFPIGLSTCVSPVPGNTLPICEQSVHPFFQIQYFSSHAKIQNNRMISSASFLSFFVHIVTYAIISLIKSSFQIMHRSSSPTNELEFPLFLSHGE